MLKILQARLQQYMNCELPDVQVGFRKGRRTWDQIDICWIMESKRVPEKHLLLLYWPCQSLWLCGSLQTWKILKEMGIPDYLACLLGNLYSGQEAMVRTRHGAMVWFKIEKEVHKGCILPPCLFKFHAEYIMWMPGWIKLKLVSRLLGEISIISGMQITPLLWQKAKRNWRVL